MVCKAIIAFSYSVFSFFEFKIRVGVLNVLCYDTIQFSLLSFQSCLKCNYAIGFH